MLLAEMLTILIMLHTIVMVEKIVLFEWLIGVNFNRYEGEFLISS